MLTLPSALEDVERQLRDREDRLRLVTNALPVLIAYVDAHETYRFANDTYVSWFAVNPEGKSVREMLGGEQGLELAAADPPEVVLLDLGMPRMNGYDVAKRIRASAWGKELLLVAITGWAEEETRARTEKAGFDVHLVKPVSRAALREVLAMDVLRR